MDNERDMEMAERWQLQSVDTVHMPMEDLEDIVMQGITPCDELFCTSKHFCGEDACRCIRSLFPHPQYYQMYRELRDMKIKLELTSSLIGLGELDG